MIYIAAPYSYKDKQVVEHRVKTVCEYSAKLLEGEISCISPITTGTGILLHADLPTDFEFWKRLSYDLLKVSDEVHILMLDGWEESIGVKAEIEFAMAFGKTIKYIEII